VQDLDEALDFSSQTGRIEGMEETVTVPARVVTVDYTGPCLGVACLLLGLVIVALVVVLVRGRRGRDNPPV